MNRHNAEHLNDVAILALECALDADDSVGRFHRGCRPAHEPVQNIEYVEGHYNVDRPHRGLDNRTIGLPEPDERGADFAQEDVICDHRLGGVLKSYRWKTAA